MAESKVVIGYWGIRGLAQFVRNFAAYLNISFEDKLYLEPTAWQTDKPTLRTNFPSLPYLLDGDKVITESQAILDYLAFRANRADLLGATPQERVLVSQIRGVYLDVRKALWDIVFNKTLVELQKEFNEKVLPKLTYLSTQLGTNDFLAGNLTVVDFFVGELLNYIRNQDGDWLAPLPNLISYADRVNSLPGVKEYHASGRVPGVFVVPSYTNERIKN